MAFDLTPGSDAVLGPKRQSKTLAMRSVSAGELGRSSIPGYTGHVRGRSAENVHGAFHGEASRLSETACSKRGVARSGADSERTRQWQGFDIMARTIDCGHMNATIGTSNADGLTQQGEFHGPGAKIASYYHNPRGHTKFRSGASVPGYAGHIPSKYAGNVFGSTYAQSCLAASGVRRREGKDSAEGGTNWILACEYDKAAKHYGSTGDLRKTIRTIGFHEGTRDAFDGTVTKPLQQTKLPKTLRHDEQIDNRAWRTYEPTQTHHKLRCYGH